MLNVIHFNYYHLFNIAYLVSEHYRDNGEKSILVAPRHCAEVLNLFELVHKSDYVFEDELKEVATKVNLVLHHYESSFPVAQTFLDSGVEISRVSLYADGLANVLLNREVRDSFFDNSSVERGDLIFFDVFPPDYQYEEKRFKILVACVSNLRKLLSCKAVAESFLCVEKLPVYDTDNVTILAMRPWGSKFFHGGLYELSDGANDLIKAIESSELFSNGFSSSKILVRGDSREKEFSEQAFKQLKKSYHDSLCIDELIPSVLGIDFFCVLLAQKVNKVTVINFDSTLALNLVPMGFIGDIIIGLEESSLQGVGMSEDAMNALRKKINRIERHFESDKFSDISCEKVDATCMRLTCQ